MKKSGSWFSYGDIKIGQGSEKVKDFFMENPGTFAEIENKIKKILGLIPDEEDESQDKK